MSGPHLSLPLHAINLLLPKVLQVCGQMTPNDGGLHARACCTPLTPPSPTDCYKSCTPVASSQVIWQEITLRRPNNLEQTIAMACDFKKNVNILRQSQRTTRQTQS